MKDLARLTHDKTLGNPFFVRQFLRDLVTDELLRVDAVGDVVVGRHGASTAAVSARTSATCVSRQVARLPAGVREILQAASCIGPEFDLDSVVSIVGGDRDDAVAGLHAALRSGLVVPARRRLPVRVRATRSASTPGSRSSTTACRRSLTSRCRPACAPRATWRSPGAAWRRATREPARVDELAVDVASHLSAAIDALDDPAERTECGRVGSWPAPCGPRP